jgi:hypothetical protein
MLLLSFIFALLLLAVASNFWRWRPQVDFNLMPNCLMTRSPLVFISGLRSPFYFQHYWNRIPMYLREHGYEILEYDLPWRDTNARREQLLIFLELAQNQNLSFHFIFDASSAPEAQWLRELKHPAVKSVTVVLPETMGLKTSVFSVKNPIAALAVLCHKFYLPSGLAFSPVVTGLGSKAPVLTTEKEFLRLAISLAEKELKVTHTESAAEVT